MSSVNVAGSSGLCLVSGTKSFKVFGAADSNPSFCLGSASQPPCAWGTIQQLAIGSATTTNYYSDATCTTLLAGGGGSFGTSMVRVAGKWILKAHQTVTLGGSGGPSAEFRSFYSEVSASDPSDCDADLLFTNDQTSYGATFDATANLYIVRVGINGSAALTRACC